MLSHWLSDRDKVLTGLLLADGYLVGQLMESVGIVFWTMYKLGRRNVASW